MISGCAWLPTKPAFKSTASGLIFPLSPSFPHPSTSKRNEGREGSALRNFLRQCVHERERDGAKCVLRRQREQDANEDLDYGVIPRCQGCYHAESVAGSSPANAPQLCRRLHLILNVMASMAAEQCFSSEHRAPNFHSNANCEIR